MNPFIFNVPSRIIFEPGATSKLGSLLSEDGVNSALVITDKGVMKAGCLEGVFGSLDSQGIIHETYDGVEQNPTEDNVREALQILRECCYDSIIAVGGGSSIDTAKAVLAMMKEGRDISELYKGVLKGEAPISLVAIPTTAGTGSEVTWSAVITDTDRKVKETARGDFMYPSIALIDPELTITLPSHITASTGMDALTHAMEAFITRGAHAMSDALALEASLLIFGHLRDAVNDGGNLRARSGMSIASTLAGMSFSISGLGVVHGMAEPLGGRYNVPHGIANSILLPHCLSFNCDAVEDKLATMARLLGMNGSHSEHESSQLLVREVARLSDDVGIPHRLDVVIDQDEFDSLISDASKNSCLPANPKPVGREDIASIYSNVLEVR